jgi:trans-feruloyl-CoA hydratase/vanillin synthase
MAENKEYSCVKLDIDDEGIAWITYNRPEKRNAMSPELHYEMEDLIYNLETNDDARIIVITGAGDAWSAGMDLREFFRATDKDPRERFRSFTSSRHWAGEYLPWSAKPTIAMVNGYCFGGAFTSLFGCDIVVTSEDATFGLSEVNWGIIPGGTVSKIFTDLVSYRDALFYAMTGRTFDGRKAVEMGVATLAVPADRLRDETLAIARELMEKAPTVLAFTKQAIRAVRDMDMIQAREYLAAKSMALQAADPEGTRGRGMAEFLDNKTYRPGLGPVARP